MNSNNLQRRIHDNNAKTDPIMRKASGGEGGGLPPGFEDYQLAVWDQTGWHMAAEPGQYELGETSIKKWVLDYARFP